MVKKSKLYCKLCELYHKEGHPHIRGKLLGVAALYTGEGLSSRALKAFRK